jgi:hypothetical protein
MTHQPQKDDLDPYEAWACDRLTELLGPLRKTDRRGGPSGLHDFEADLPNGSTAALEVTGEVDKERLDLATSAQRHVSSITVPDSICSSFQCHRERPRPTNRRALRHDLAFTITVAAGG